MSKSGSKTPRAVSQSGENPALFTFGSTCEWEREHFGMGTGNKRLGAFTDRRCQGWSSRLGWRGPPPCSRNGLTQGVHRGGRSGAQHEQPVWLRKAALRQLGAEGAGVLTGGNRSHAMPTRGTRGGVAGVDFVREANRKEVGLLPNDSVRILFLSFLCLWVSRSSSWEGTSLAPSQHRSCCRTAFQGGVEGTLERPGACTTWPVRVLGGGYPGYPVGGG